LAKINASIKHGMLSTIWNFWKSNISTTKTVVLISQ
jgi:hypothetical protein